MSALTERLGFESDARMLIVHCDDFGMCHAENVGTQDALERGVANSASIMTPCPWRNEAIAYALAHPHADIGMHCTVTSEWDEYRWGPVAGRDAVPSLVDPDGYLWKWEEPFAASARPEDVERELRAQHALLTRAGVDLTHIDMHMEALISKPEFFDVYTGLAQEFRLPFMFPDPTRGLRELFDPGYQRVSKASEEALAERGLFAVDRLIMSMATGGPRAPQYADIIASLEPGLTQIITHVAVDTPEIRAAAITRGAEGYTYRFEDYEALLDPALQAAIEADGVRLVTWRQIRDVQYGAASSSCTP